MTSTYFEGASAANSQAHRGYSRDKRPDCVQVCIGLVVTPEGLPLAYEVFDGNRTDVTTVEQIVETMRAKYGHERRTWVMDRGMVSEDNLDELRVCGASYLVGTPKAMLKKFERELLAEDWEQIEPGVEVKVCRAPDGTDETFVLCRSPQRKEKEKAMRRRQIDGMEEALARLKARIEAPTRALRELSKAERRVGRMMQKCSRAAHLYDVKIGEVADPSHKSGVRLTVAITVRDERREWVEQTDGVRCLAASLSAAHQSSRIRRATFVEDLHRPDANRRLFPDQQARSGPAAHFSSHARADPGAHFSLLSRIGHVAHAATYGCANEVRVGAGLGSAPRKLLEELAEVRSLDVVLPTRTGRAIRLRTVSKPDKHLAILLQRLGLPLPNKPKKIQNVVQTFALEKA
ncbi:IS1634 family transposase [Candidatus Sumerlaeota bacterium]